MTPYSGPSTRVPMCRGGWVLRLADGRLVIGMQGLVPADAIFMDPEDNPCETVPRVLFKAGEIVPFEVSR